MKKIFLLFLLLEVCIGTFSQTRNIGIGIIADGTDILTGTNQMLQGGDVRWSIKLVKNACIVKDENCVFGPWIDAYDVNKLMLAFDLNELTFPCGTWAVGDLIEVCIEVVNPNHPFAGYKGKTIFAAPQVDRDYWGGEGINLIGAPALKIEVYDTTLCASPGQIIPAIVSNAPEDYQVLWPDSRLTGLPGDKALVGASFSADSTYRLSAILTDKNGLPLDTAFFELSFDTLPGVEIVEDDFCLAQGDALFVNGIIPANSNHQWVSTENRSRSALAESVPTQYSTVMPDHNVKITLTATSTLTGCRNSDSVFVYLRPDKPIISIDTNTTRNNLKISWNADEKANGYTLWSNKWDAYGIEKPYSQKAAFSKGITSYAINTAELDTLEFFYLTVGSNPVCPAMSDTVGYKFDRIHVNADPKLTSNNLISWMFDMTGKNVKTSADAFDLLYHEISALRRWDVLTQQYIATLKNPVFGKVPNAPKYINVFDFSQGGTYQFAAVKECTLLQFGVLKSKLEYTLVKSNTSTHNNQFGLAVHKIGLKNTSDVFGQLTTDNIDAVRVWNFAAQQWVATLKNPAFGIVPGALEFVPVHNIKVGTPLQLPLKASKTSYIWK